MASAARLSIAFIEKRPVAAARVLASLGADEAAGFLNDIPPRHAARAVAAMNASDAAGVVARMEPQAAGPVLTELHYPEASAILRLIAPDLRARILDKVAQKLRRSFEVSLSFPQDTVGAHMSTSILTMGPEQRIADAIALVRRSTDADSDSVFVLDGARRFAGVVPVAALLRHPEHLALDDVMDDSVEPLSARARLASVADLAAWDEHGELPVLSRQRQVIGALSRRHARPGASRSSYAGPRNTASVSAAAGAALLGLARLAFGSAGGASGPPVDRGGAGS